MLSTPVSIDPDRWVAGDPRARFFYRCRDCETTFTSVVEPRIVVFKREHGWQCAMERAAKALQAR